ELLRTVLTADEADERRTAAAELGELAGPAASGPLALLAVLPWEEAAGAGSRDRGGGGSGGAYGDGPGGGESGPGSLGTDGPVPHVLARCVVPGGSGGAGGPGGSGSVSRPVLAALVRLRSAEAREAARA